MLATLLQEHPPLPPLGPVPCALCPVSWRRQTLLTKQPSQTPLSLSLLYFLPLSIPTTPFPISPFRGSGACPETSFHIDILLAYFFL